MALLHIFHVGLDMAETFWNLMDVQLHQGSRGFEVPWLQGESGFRKLCEEHL